MKQLEIPQQWRNVFARTILPNFGLLLSRYSLLYPSSYYQMILLFEHCIIGIIKAGMLNKTQSSELVLE